MKLGLLLPTNIYFCPYVKIYTDILDKNNIQYDIVYADKRGLKEEAAYRYTRKIDDKANKIAKLLYYWGYSRFLRKTIKREQYDKLIVFGPQVAIFLKSFLKKHYKKKFILDYRDLSIEQNFKGIYGELMELSSLHVVSSPGFIKCLPDVCKSVLSHNFDINILKQAINDNDLSYTINKKEINVLTIGGIRDYEQNAAIIEALGNRENFLVSFVGRGIDAPRLEEFAKKGNYKNVVFSGYYDKKDETSIIGKSTMMNIFYPRRLSHDTALSNRFYNSIFFRKPMITTADTIQGEYTKNYKLGLAITNTSNLAEEITTYLNTFDKEEYEENRKKLLKDFYSDYELFEEQVLAFCR
ncbi:glycosyltransferase family protein [Prevotella falsenii]|uniref:capsular biosynthesis protein n=1 Tax=Prevotella falsenii TaxID=515414 RepID=UPI000468C60E|nr:capsular biosynthesis protein [Prevotella falsenii]